jgi:putative ABC transport system substrate-binding protein
LRELGYTPGRNIRIDERSLVDGYDALADAARRLAAEKPDVIVTYGATAATVAAKATQEIPVVMVSTGDPVRLGLAKSLSRPGGNLTGLSSLNVDLSGKRMEVLKEAFPSARRVAVLLYPGSQIELVSYSNYQAAAQALGMEVRRIDIRSADEISPAVARISKAEIDAITVVGSTLFRANADRLVAEVSKARLPIIYTDGFYADHGGLMSYGSAISENFRRAAAYVDKILKGAKPGDLPIEQPTRLELVVNLKAAKEQGIAIPRAVVLRADRVIQ